VSAPSVQPPAESEQTIPILQYLSKYIRGPQYEPSSDLLGLWPSIYTETDALDTDIVEQMGKAAYLLCATELYVDAFDLYYVIFACKFKQFAFAGINMLVAVLDCARTSATRWQDECTIPILKFALRGCFNTETHGYITSRILLSQIGDQYVDQPEQGQGTKMGPNKLSHLYL
jgi:hypothetical protein